MLEGIGLSTGSLYLASFVPWTSNYLVYLPSTVSSVTMTPAKTVRLHGLDQRGERLIQDLQHPRRRQGDGTIACTGPGGVAQTYTVNFYRIAPITAIEVFPGTLSPVFAVGTQDYTVRIPATIELRHDKADHGCFVHADEDRRGTGSP